MIIPDFLIRGLLAGVAIGAVAPLIGSFIVAKRYALIADTLAHISLLGVAIGVVIGISPTITAVFVSIVASILIERLNETKRISGETLLAIFLTSGLSLSLIVLSLKNGINTNLLSYLFGSISTVGSNELIVVLAVSAIIGAILLLLSKELLYVVYDEESAKISGVNTRLLNSILVIATAAIVAVSIQIVGALLIGALIVIPTTAAKLISLNAKQYQGFSVFFGVISVISGTLFAYSFNLPAGAAIVMIALAILGFSIIVKNA
jgi:zinc transport system permease protein